MARIDIRDLTTFDEFLLARDVQRACWDASNSEGLHPPMLLTVSENGGIVLGAFDGDKLVGYLFGFVGLFENRGPLELWSQSMAVLPEYRSRGIAESLKWAQRDRALKLGFKLISWMFDPLDSQSAYRNLHKLDAIVRTYRRDVYSKLPRTADQGLPQDRLLAEWWIEQAADLKRTVPRQGGTLITRIQGTGSDQRMVEYELGSNDDTVMIEIPTNIEATFEPDKALAADWQVKVREILESYFARGYIGLDFNREKNGDGHRNYYALWRPPAGWLPQLTGVQ